MATHPKNACTRQFVSRLSSSPYSPTLNSQYTHAQALTLASTPSLCSTTWCQRSCHRGDAGGTRLKLVFAFHPSLPVVSSMLVTFSISLLTRSALSSFVGKPRESIASAFIQVVDAPVKVVCFIPNSASWYCGTPPFILLAVRCLTKFEALAHFVSSSAGPAVQRRTESGRQRPSIRIRSHVHFRRLRSVRTSTQPTSMHLCEL